MNTLHLLALLSLSNALVVPPSQTRLIAPKTWTRQGVVGCAKRKGDLFNEIADIENSGTKVEVAEATNAPVAPVIVSADKEKAMLSPEEVIFEGPPSWTEMVLPGISVLTVVGIVPFIASVSRQAWVKYKFTSRRISVTSGFNGQDLTEITYDEIFNMKFVYRSFGSVGDLIIEVSRKAF